MENKLNKNNEFNNHYFYNLLFIINFCYINIFTLSISFIYIIKSFNKIILYTICIYSIIYNNDKFVLVIKKIDLEIY